MTSLGFRPRNDHIAERVRPTTALSAPSSTSTSLPSAVAPRCVFPVVRGFIPTLILSALATAIPLCFFYLDMDEVDYQKATAQRIIVAGAAVGGFLIIVANDCSAWYNMMLGFHIGIEVRVVEKTLAYAYEDSTSDEYMSWALAAAVVIISHLVPFLLTDRLMLLTFIAYAGLIVNVITVVFLFPELLLVVTGSSIALLATTMLICGVCEVNTSILSLLMKAIRTKTLLKIQSFEL